MTDIDITVSYQDIDFNPGGIIYEVMQNVRTILTTVKGSVPLDREFGVNAAVVDEPVTIARARLSREIIQSVRKYEPRARVMKVEYEESDAEGTLRPRVKVRINEE